MLLLFKDIVDLQADLDYQFLSLMVHGQQLENVWLQ